MDLNVFTEKCKGWVERMSVDVPIREIIFEEYHSLESNMHHGTILCYGSHQIVIAYNFDYCDILGFQSKSSIITKEMIESLKNIL